LAPNRRLLLVVDPSDWRLTNQMKFLRGVALVRRPYRRYAKNPDWDHDHCAFCWAKFMEGNDPECLHEGYATPDDYHWICVECFADFREMFEWAAT